MGYIEDNLTSQENIIYRGRLSKAKMIFWVFVSICLMVVLVGFIMFPIIILRYLSTEVAVTTRRVIYKKGFIVRTVNEINSRSIEKSRFNQSIVGRILGYGTVQVEGMRSERIIIPGIQNPRLLNKAVNESVDLLTAQQFPRVDFR